LIGRCRIMDIRREWPASSLNGRNHSVVVDIYLQKWWSACQPGGTSASLSRVYYGWRLLRLFISFAPSIISSLPPPIHIPSILLCLFIPCFRSLKSPRVSRVFSALVDSHPLPKTPLPHLRPTKPATMSTADFEADSRGYEGKLPVPPRVVSDSLDDTRYDRRDASRSPRGDMRGGGESRARSASPNGHDRGDTR
jgi:hypothetical protein